VPVLSTRNSSDVRNGRLVVGGIDAEFGQVPFALSLQVNGQHSCGASLISETKAVTAAHCGGGIM